MIELRLKKNKPVVFAVLDNDKDADGDKLKSYLYLHQRMVEQLMINENDTITFEPSIDFVGVRIRLLMS